MKTKSYEEKVRNWIIQNTILLFIVVRVELMNIGIEKCKMNYIETEMFTLLNKMSLKFQKVSISVDLLGCSTVILKMELFTIV